MEKHEKNPHPTHPKSVWKEAVDVLAESSATSQGQDNFIELHRLDAQLNGDMIFANHHFCIFTSKNSPSPQSIDDCNIVMIKS